LKREEALDLIISELNRATRKYGAFQTKHEGYGVIMEEFREFEEAIRGKDLENLKEETVQCAAMFLRFLVDTF